MAFTTIQIEGSTLEELKGLREYPKQSYNELIKKMIAVRKATLEHNQYDEFLHKIQQQKMKELWDNSYDERWKDV